ncbi:MAG: hypothetical protein KC417_14205, partial [Myxococcales bacterium]|nr:hypothetical protein [Myxococcales bacterium]
YLVYYKTVFALDHGERKATWARLTDTDIVGAQAVPGGLLIGEQSGRVSLLDARTGETVWSKSVGRTAQAISFNAQTAMGSAGAAKAADGSTTDALAAVAQSLDVRLAPAQALAVDLLGGLSDEAVAGHLITLCENRRLPKGVRAQACKSLAERATGTDEIIFALTRHASFLEGSTAPPAGALGLAAAKAKLKDALPLLIAHLKDPHTPSDELPALMMALAQFKDRSAAAPIRDFVRMYHADDWEADLVKALVLGVDAMRALLGPAARDALEEFAANPLGMSEVRNEATKELAKLDTKSAATPSKNEGTAADNAEPSQGAPAPSQTR